MTLKLLLEQGFDLSGNKEKAITKNEKVARVWLKPDDTKKQIEKIKNDEEMNNRDKTNYLMAVHTLRKIAANKRLKQERRDTAEKLLKNAGIDLTSLGDEDKELLKNAKETFQERFNEINKGPEEETPEKEPESKKDKPAAATKTEPEKEEPDEDEPDVQDEPEEDDNKEAEELTATPRQAANRVAELRKETIPKIQKIVDEMKEGDKKLKENEARKLLSKFEKRMDKLQEKALAGPRNARQALNLAKAEARNYANKASGIPLKTAVGRGIQGTKEALGKAKESAEKTIGRAKEAYRKSETLEKIGQTAGKVKERIVPAVEKGVEKVGRKIEQAGITKDYNLIKKYVNDQAAEQFLANPESDLAKNLLAQAKEKRNKQSKTLKQRIGSVRRNTSGAASSIGDLRKKLSSTIGTKSPSTRGSRRAG